MAGGILAAAMTALTMGVCALSGIGPFHDVSDRRGGGPTRATSEARAVASSPDVQVMLSAPPRPLQGYEGTWNGSVKQADDNPAYQVVLKLGVIELGKVAGTSEYPGLPCSGSLTVTAASEEELDVTENIVRNNGRCVAVAQLRFRLQANGTLLYLTDAAPGVSRSEGTLSRTG
ncbi:hypothetical protein [Longispora urticae]